MTRIAFTIACILTAASIGYAMAPRHDCLAGSLPSKHVAVALRKCEGELKLAVNAVHGHQDALQMVAGKLGQCFGSADYGR